MYNCIRIQSNLALTPALLITTLMINLLWPPVVNVFITAVSHLCFVPMQRKETENPRYSEKREGCHSGEFCYTTSENVLDVCCCTESHINPILLIIIQAYRF